MKKLDYINYLLKNIISLFLILGSCFNLIGQSVFKDSLEVSTYDKFIIDKHNVNEKKLCSDFIRLASRMCKNDSIVLPLYTSMKDLRSLTFRELLKNRYGLLEVDIINGDFVPESISCFEEYMKGYAENKFGVDFLKNTKKDADSIDREGLGFVLAKPVNSCNSIEKELKKKIKFSKKLFEDERIIRVLVFEVLQNGEFSNISFKAGHLGTPQIEFDILDDEYEQEILNVLKSMPNWLPATLLGRPVVSNVTFVINKDWR